MARNRTRARLGQKIKRNAAEKLRNADADKVAKNTAKVGRFLDKAGEVTSVVFPRIGKGVEKAGEALNNQSDRIGNAVGKAQDLQAKKSALQPSGAAKTSQRQPPKSAQKPRLGATPAKPPASAGAALRAGSGSVSGTPQAANPAASPEQTPMGTTSDSLIPGVELTGSKAKDAALIGVLGLLGAKATKLI